jgi:hypothetical protein
MGEKMTKKNPKKDRKAAEEAIELALQMVGHVVVDAMFRGDCKVTIEGDQTERRRYSIAMECAMEQLGQALAAMRAIDEAIAEEEEDDPVRWN